MVVASCRHYNAHGGQAGEGGSVRGSIWGIWDVRRDLVVESKLRRTLEDLVGHELAVKRGGAGRAGRPLVSFPQSDGLDERRIDI